MESELFGTCWGDQLLGLLHAEFAVPLHKELTTVAAEAAQQKKSARRLHVGVMETRLPHFSPCSNKKRNRARCCGFEQPELYQQGLEERIARKAPRRSRRFFISLVTGVIYISTDTDVCGHADMSFEVRSTTGAPPLQEGYTATVTNRMAKAISNSSKTRAHMASQALHATLTDMKRDIDTKVANTNRVATAQ